MTSRLDRLFILLETGTNAVTKRAAAQQLGEVQHLHPHELHRLLGRILKLLKSPQWDTRICAAEAVRAILGQVPVWDPQPLKQESCESGSQEPASFSTFRLSLENFDMDKILAQSSHLTGSEGSEYDLVVDGDTTGPQDEKLIAAKLGLHPRLMGVDPSDLFTAEDLNPVQPPVKYQMDKISIQEALSNSTGLSRREMNLAKRKARQFISKQRSRESDDNCESGNSLNSTKQNGNIPEPKKIKLEDGSSSDLWWNLSGGCGESSSAVPDVTGCWPESATEWPLEGFAEGLGQDLFSQKWEVRHGAATALRELLRLHGRGAGKSRNQTSEEMEISHRRWLIDIALRLLCVLGLDRFGDFISDQVVAPVRETCAQTLGSLLLLLSNKTSENDLFNTYSFNTTNCEEIRPDAEQLTEKNNVNVTNLQNEKSNKENNKDLMRILTIILKLLNHNEWEARHGSLLALKYFLAVRDDMLDEILPIAFPAIMKGLSDPVEDVGAAAAGALIPVAPALSKFIEADQLEAIVMRLWELLKEQDDLAAACNSFMGLLAAILSLPTARARLKPQPLAQILPRLWPFLGHTSTNVRKATLQTLQTLTGDDGDHNLDPKGRWGVGGGVVLQEALRHVFERVLIEHVSSIQQLAESVWENLVVRSDLELLLHAACPLVSTWLCLAMQPEYVPFNSNLLLSTSLQKVPKSVQQMSNCEGQSVNNIDKPTSQFKVYIGGIETVLQSIRHSNVIKSRCMAARMLGLLSRYIVRPAPGVVYTPDIPSPSLCYAKVLLAHLNSRSALQRMITGFTIAHWAWLEQTNSPQIPDILKDRLSNCLNECVYYDEIAASVTRLLHECRDYIATLRHYKFPLPIEENPNVIMTLDQIVSFASNTVPALSRGEGAASSNNVTSESGNTTVNVLKLKPKIVETMEERRRALESGALSALAHQQSLHVMTMAALAGAAIMLQCLPPPPQPLNPLVKPLMEAIKTQEDEQLQGLAAMHLSYLVNFCVDRTPCPNPKIATNLCTFVNSDAEFTPRIIQTGSESDPFNGILSLNNKQKHAERVACRVGSVGASTVRGPGRPPNTGIPLEELLACEEPEAKAARIRCRGATAALTAIATLFGGELAIKLPHLWNLMLPTSLQTNNSSDAVRQKPEEEAEKLVYSLQVLEILAPSLDRSLLPPVMNCLPNLCSLLVNPYKAVRHMAARCVATLALLDTAQVMKYVVQNVIPLLESNTIVDNEDGTELVAAPNQVDTRRQGAAEALSCLVEKLGVSVVPYAVMFMVPLLGRMSDQNQAVRLACSGTFATLVQLLPLDPGEISDPSYLVEEKARGRRFLDQLLNPRNIPDTVLPFKVAAELRSYQQQGLNWLNFLNQYRLHGVLCDDMGLGKTLQTLCILALEYHRNPQTPPSLVVCPPTVTGHWVYEAKKFFQANDLNVLQYAGNPVDRVRLRTRIPQHRLIVGSYDIVRKDIEFFESIQWNYCVLDEGHVIKNGKTKSAKATKKLRANHRLILSGTPVQNDVLELWSLFDFLMPGFLGSEKQFAAKYSRPIVSCREPKAGRKEQEGGALAMEALHRQVLPFLLRRNKEDVLQDLPPKITQDYYCELSPLQKQLYEDFRTKHSAVLSNATDPTHLRPGYVFEALRYLRNVCNHPKLVLSPKHPQYQSIMSSWKNKQIKLTDIEHGAKLLALKQLLLDCGIGESQPQQMARTAGNSTMPQDGQQSQQLVSQHRALIFCQLRTMLDIVERDLIRVHFRTVTYLRLDGTTPPALRHSIVTRFNADPSIDILLLTTQVGGIGLNLTGADTVIFVEHDWNPMKDLQAMDRAHRIGQKKVVNVYRLITRSTVEEKIMGLQKFKLLTANTVISPENSSLSTMGTDQLLDLFSLDEDNRSSSQSQHGGTSKSKVSATAGIPKSVSEIIPELWEQQQYEDEYNMDAFLATLKGESSQA